MITEKNDTAPIYKFIGVTIEYRTANMRLLLWVYLDDKDDPNSKFITNIVWYVRGSTRCKEILEAGDYDTYDEALQIGRDFIEDNFKLVDID